ncbi:MAG: YicC family protein [Gammaproteobacteria bacterium]|nr:YicC family protein [Gammaproteobacteria bacterium]
MTQSMTAFSTTAAQDNNMQFTWEIRSVNQRFLDISIRLPQMFRSLESEIRQKTTHVIKRGKVECLLTLKESQQNHTLIELNTELVNQIIVACREITAQQPSVSPPNVMEILSWPGVQVEQQLEIDTVTPVIFEALDRTLCDLTAMRQREGEQLASLLHNKCDQVKQHTSNARQRLPQVLDQIRLRIIDRIKLLEIEPDTDRLEQEIVYLAQKMDITEELDRLDTHVLEIKNTLQKNEAIGRRLDFLMQELNREANTIGSKSADTTISQVSIELKVLIEQMREQVQNIE